MHSLRKWTSALTMLLQMSCNSPDEAPSGLTVGSVLPKSSAALPPSPQPAARDDGPAVTIDPPPTIRLLDAQALVRMREDQERDNARLREQAQLLRDWEGK